MLKNDVRNSGLIWWLTATFLITVMPQAVYAVDKPSKSAISNKVVKANNSKSNYCANLEKAGTSFVNALNNPNNDGPIGASIKDLSALFETLPSDLPDNLNRMYQLMNEQALLLQKQNDVDSGRGFQSEMDSFAKNSVKAKNSTYQKDNDNFLKSLYLTKEKQGLKNKAEMLEKEAREYEQSSQYKAKLADYLQKKCPALMQKYKNKNILPGATASNTANRHEIAEDCTMHEAPLLLQTGATAKMDGMPLVNRCLPKFSTKVVNAVLGSNIPPGTLLAKPTKGMRYVSITLELTNHTPTDGKAGKGLCPNYTDNIQKTIFRMKANGLVFDNQYINYMWPSIPLGNAGLVPLVFEIPADAKELKLLGDADDEILATWQLGK